MKTVLITGGTRGIGRAMVELFLQNSYRTLFLFCKSDSEAKELEEKGAVGYKVDLSSKEELERTLQQILKEESVDILINNAGVSLIGLFTLLENEEVEKLYQINLMAPLLITKKLLPSMISKKWGRIINISSMWGQVGASCEVDYSVSKAGLIGFTKALAKEVGPSNITVNCICPGVIDTEMNAAIDESTMKELISDTPMERIGTPEDIAHFALYLAREEASFITGQIVGLNGGMVIT